MPRFESYQTHRSMEFLRSPAGRTRKAAALKCISALSKTRIARILDDYLSGANRGHLGRQDRYYNVIHWLDFGVSAPRDRASVAAKKVLNSEWPRQQSRPEFT